MKPYYIILATLLVVSCAKEPAQPIEVPITIQVGSITSGPLTKSVAALIDATAPSGQVSLRLQSKTNPNRRYTVTPGTTVSVAIDTYTVTGEYVPQAVFSCWRGAFYKEPRYSVSETLSVTADRDTYTIPAAFSSFALIWDKGAVSRYYIWNASGTPEEPTGWVEDDGLAILYGTCTSGWSRDYPLTILAEPADDVNYEPTTFSLVTASATGCVLVENGKWYQLNPGAVATSSGSLGVTLPDWTEGTTNL